MKCNKCKTEKPLTEYHKGKKWCKPCRAVRTREYYERKTHEVLERNRQWRKNNPEKIYARTVTLRADPAHTKRYNETHKQERHARYQIVKAIRNGRLTRPDSCDDCGLKAKQIHAHHYLGYSPEHWTDVQWLCVRCHVIAHNGHATTAGISEVLA